MKIAFLDFEFGQINGSYRTDFLVTQAAVLIYDTNLDSFKIAEIIFKPDTELIMRKRIRDENNKYKLEEKNINYYKNITTNYNKNFKIPKAKRREIRQKWNYQYSNKLIYFLNNTLKNSDKICVFGGKEDINILRRYKYKYSINNIIDIQTILFKTYKILYSLDRVIDTLNITNFLHQNYIKSINYTYNLPKKSKKLYRYNVKNLNAHNASGDCIRLFLVYKELLLNSSGTLQTLYKIRNRK
jgi:hypothetical protein